MLPYLKFQNFKLQDIPSQLRKYKTKQRTTHYAEMLGSYEKSWIPEHHNMKAR